MEHILKCRVVVILVRSAGHEERRRVQKLLEVMGLGLITCDPLQRSHASFSMNFLMRKRKEKRNRGTAGREGSRERRSKRGDNHMDDHDDGESADGMCSFRGSKNFFFGIKLFLTFWKVRSGNGGFFNGRRPKSGSKSRTNNRKSRTKKQKQQQQQKKHKQQAAQAATSCSNSSTNSTNQQQKQHQHFGRSKHTRSSSNNKAASSKNKTTNNNGCHFSGVQNVFLGIQRSAKVVFIVGNKKLFLAFYVFLGYKMFFWDFFFVWDTENFLGIHFFRIRIFFWVHRKFLRDTK